MPMTHTPPDPLELSTTRPPEFSVTDAQNIAARHFGISADARPVDSERDQNFRLDGHDGLRRVLKIANPAERFEVIDFQNCALRHVAEKDPGIKIPRVIPGLDGQLIRTIEVAGKSYLVRVLSWLEGVEVDGSASSSGLARKLGQMLARLGLALRDFDHPASNPELLWDLKRASNLREMLGYMQGSEYYDVVEKTLDRFDQVVSPQLGSLRTQVIFNDLHSGNVLMDATDQQSIAGIIDFGDLVKSPLVNDLAVAAAYQLTDGDDPLAGALPMIASYHSTCPLQRVEMNLLTDLISTRLISTLCIGSCRAKLFPENIEYVLGDHASAGNRLASLDSLPEKDAFERIEAVCHAP
jgi:hydroxylysine kinase